MSSVTAILLWVAAIVMARKGRRGRRKFRRYLKGKIDFDLALGTLGGNTNISTNVADVLVESAWLSSVKAVWSLASVTPVAADGPMMCGIAHSDYTTIEIQEWILNLDSWDQGDKIAQEINRRKIRQVGIFPIEGAGGGAGARVLNEGRMVTTKANWQLTTGDTVKIWVFNTGAGALTTGATLHVNGHANLWPN